MQNIINHNNHPSMTTYPTNLTAGCINPIRRTSYKKTLNINSRFRNNYSTTPATDFFLTMPETLDKVVSMKMSNLLIPKMIYTVNPTTGSNNFKITFSHASKASLDQTKRIILPGGSYSPDQMEEMINTIFDYHISDVSELKYIRSRFNIIDGKFSFDISWNNLVDYKHIEIDFKYIEPGFDTMPCHLDTDFQIKKDFCSNNNIYSNVSSNIFKNQLTLGWLLGFRRDYRFNTPKTSIQNKEVENYLSSCCNETKPPTRKELRNLNHIRRSRDHLTKIKNDGQVYKQETYNCGLNNCLKNYPEPYDISFSYVLENPLFKGGGTTSDPHPEFGHSYSAESVYDPIGNRYFLLSVNDFQNHHNHSFISLMQEESTIDGNILARVHCDCNTYPNIDVQERIYFGPTSISRLHIKLMDEFGRIIDLNNADYSFTLELEVLYDL